MEEKVSDHSKKNGKGFVVCVAVAVIVIIAALVVSTIAINAKKNSNKDEEKSDNLKQMVGTYKLIEMSTDGRDQSEDVNTLDNLGLTVKLEINEDRTAKLSMFGDSTELTYDEKEFKDKDSSIPYVYQDGKIQLEQENEKMVFEKINIDETETKDE